MRCSIKTLFESVVRESAPPDRPTASGGAASPQLAAATKDIKRHASGRLGSPLETRAPDRRDRDCDRRTSRRPLWHPGREHGSNGIRLLLPGGTDAAAVLCEPPFERLELPRAHSRDGHLRRRRTRPHDRGPRDEGTSLSCGGSDLRPDVHATGASVWGRDLPNVSEV